ncbi:hypothetical protein [Aneurinibacillus terranovensis]
MIDESLLPRVHSHSVEVAYLGHEGIEELPIRSSKINGNTVDG